MNITFLLIFISFIALNTFVFRLALSKTDDVDNFSSSSKRARFSMNLVNIMITSSACGTWLSSATLWDKVTITMFGLVAAFFIYVHHYLTQKILERADYLIGIGLNITVFIVVFFMTVLT